MTVFASAGRLILNALIPQTRDQDLPLSADCPADSNGFRFTNELLPDLFSTLSAVIFFLNETQLNPTRASPVPPSRFTPNSIDLSLTCGWLAPA